MRTAVTLTALLTLGAAPVQAACEALVTGGGTPAARWEQVATPDAVGAVAYTEATRLAVSDRYPICVFAEPSARDLDVSVRFRPIGGRMDRAGGLAVRVHDANTYYVLRANAAEDNVRLYHVTQGRRVQFAGKERVPIVLGAWHSLRLRLEGERFQAWLNERLLFEARDGRIVTPGRVALWSIADSQTLFETPRIEVIR